MLITTKSYFVHTTKHDCSHQLSLKGHRRSTITLAKKKNVPENLDTMTTFRFTVSINKNLAKAAIAILGLGFVDAGYSGDWSRIGIITTETEDLLKAAAFLVVPLCLFLIFTLSKKVETEDS